MFCIGYDAEEWTIKLREKRKAFMFVNRRFSLVSLFPSLLLSRSLPPPPLSISHTPLSPPPFPHAFACPQLVKNLQKQSDDLALAKALQEQERAFMLLASSATATATATAAGKRSHGGEGSAAAAAAAAPAAAPGCGAGARGDEGEEEGEGDVLDDEALAWKLHEEMEREHVLALAGVLPSQRRQLGEEEEEGAAAAAVGNGEEGEEREGEEAGEGEGEEGEEEEEEEEEEDPAALSYERLTALTDVVGVAPKKASSSALSKIVVGPYKPRKAWGEKEGDKEEDEEQKQEGEEEEQCAVCRVELETGEDAATLPCGHAYHEACVLAWLERAKSCPVCGAELEEGE
jgi:hypothetical protein